MTCKEAFHKTSDWKRRINLISYFHHARLAKNKNWKLTDSAKYFGCSIGLISESLNLSKHFDRVKQCHSRSEALRKMK